jgi:hypothetical protein
MIRPTIGAERDRMAAVMVGAVDQDAMDAGRAHFAKGDFLGPVHPSIKARSGRSGNRLA